VGTERDRGVELSADYAPIDVLQLSGQASWLKRKNLSSPDIKLTGAPERKYVIAANWRFLPLWQLRADAQHESSRLSNTTGTRIADSFTLVNSFVRFSPVPNIGIEVGGRNLTDKLYAYEEGFYEPGRTWLAQIDYHY
jgi:iron complex outermembrane receptor protein